MRIITPPSTGGGPPITLPIPGNGIQAPVDPVTSYTIDSGVVVTATNGSPNLVWVSGDLATSKFPTDSFIKVGNNVYQVQIVTSDTGGITLYSNFVGTNGNYSVLTTDSFYIALETHTGPPIEIYDVDAAGRVSSGPPSVLFHVANTNGQVTGRFNSVIDNDPWAANDFKYLCESSSGLKGATTYTVKSRGSISAPAAVAVGDVLSQYITSANDGSGPDASGTYTAYPVAEIRTIAQGPVSVGNIRGLMRFFIRDNLGIFGNPVTFDAFGEVINGFLDVANALTSQRTGTVSVSNGNPVVTGVGTLFTTELEIGDVVKFGAFGLPYTILSISNPTTLTLTTNFGQTTQAGLLYYTAQNPLLMNDAVLPTSRQVKVNYHGDTYLGLLPTDNISIGGASTTAKLNSVVDNLSKNNTQLLTYNSVTSQGARLVMGAARGTAALPLALVNNDLMFTLVGLGHNGTNFGVGPSITAIVSGTPPTTGLIPSRMLLNGIGNFSDSYTSLSLNPDRSVTTASVLIGAGKNVQQVSASFNLPSTAGNSEYIVNSAGTSVVTLIDTHLPISTITSVGTTATVTLSSAAVFSINPLVQITGATQPEYNGTFAVTIVSPTVFTYKFPGSATSPATGAKFYQDLMYYPIGMQIDFIQGGAGKIQFVSAPVNSLNVPLNFTAFTSNQGKRATLIRTTSSLWTLVGELQPLNLSNIFVVKMTVTAAQLAGITFVPFFTRSSPTAQYRLLDFSMSAEASLVGGNRQLQVESSDGSLKYTNILPANLTATTCSRWPSATIPAPNIPSFFYANAPVGNTIGVIATLGTTDYTSGSLVIEGRFLQVSV